MPIKNDISSLPTAPARTSRKPSSHPIVVNELADAWYQRYLESGKAEYLPAIPTLPFRLSDISSRCDLQIYLKMTDTEPSNPPGPADAWRFQLGHYVGDAIAEAMGALGDGWFAEWNVDLRPIGVEGSAHVDLVHLICSHCQGPMSSDGADGTDAAGNPSIYCVECIDQQADDKFDLGTGPGFDFRCDYTVEVKSINGFGWKKAATDFKGPAEGPKVEHILQGALAAKALDCDRLIIAYFGIENLSPDMAAKFTDSEIGRFCGEWHFAVTALEPLIAAEVSRIQRLLKFRGTTMLPARELHMPDVPAGAVIVDPAKSAWQVIDGGEIAAAGTAWYGQYCRYCNQQDRCIEIGERAGAEQDD